MFSLLTFAAFTCGFFILTSLYPHLLGGLLLAFGLLPEESLSYLGNTEGGSIVLMGYFILMFLGYLFSLNPLFKAISRISSYVISIKANIAPYFNKVGVQNMNSAISRTKLFFWLEALFKLWLLLATKISCLCFCVTAFLSGSFGFGIFYGVVTYVIHQINLTIKDNEQFLGKGIFQIEKDIQAHYRNHALAETKENNIRIQQQALAHKQQEYQNRLEAQERREQVYLRDQQRRRRDNPKSLISKIIRLLR